MITMSSSLLNRQNIQQFPNQTTNKTNLKFSNILTINKITHAVIQQI